MKNNMVYQIFQFPGIPTITIKIPVEYYNIEKCLELAEKLQYKVRHGTLGMGISNNNFGIIIPFRGPNGLVQLECRCEISNIKN